jgi:hypothetical protein
LNIKNKKIKFKKNLKPSIFDKFKETPGIIFKSNSPESDSYNNKKTNGNLSNIVNN